MEHTIAPSAEKITMLDPVKITHAEPWQWEILAKAFLPDPTLNFWLGKKTSESTLKDFFEAVVKDTLESGGSVFSTPDCKAVIVWTRFGYSIEPPTQWKKRWYDVLDPDGVKRYYWLYEAGGITIEPDRLNNSMLPDYMGVLTECQGKGYGGQLFKRTLNYFDEQGFESPMILASTRRSAKLYGPLLGFHIHKEIFASSVDAIPVGVFMKRNEPEV